MKAGLNNSLNMTVKFLKVAVGDGASTSRITFSIVSTEQKI